MIEMALTRLKATFSQLLYRDMHVFVHRASWSHACQASPAMTAFDRYPQPGLQAMRAMLLGPLFRDFETLEVCPEEASAGLAVSRRSREA
ncbi:hypothetical protein L207DRAFT_517030 [Hyaloscypha variabilis F]|uniref:Uncharacterized protein n=1 Tax=Hyaloscypha variabilis (strain UAMH 11265 / GT02V1 / F) TaxID=1149755 RepID=A0A2J6R8S7_HYAVF|nr:hypothetical protein L207DRAFT_517030 [Hyaloscypha variabilis F]